MRNEKGREVSKEEKRIIWDLVKQVSMATEKKVKEREGDRM